MCAWQKGLVTASLTDPCQMYDWMWLITVGKT
jgi:hypothetical protein